MFKKAIKTTNRTQISGKDKKTIKKDLERFFNPDAVKDFLDSNEVIYCDKVSGGKQLIFSNEVNPLLVDATGKGDYLPSLYTLCLHPNLCNFVEINPGVESFVLKGANLMWAGVKPDQDLGQFEADDVRYVKSSEGKIIAVGAMACSSKELAKNGAQGPALIPLHIIGDKLWELGNQIEPEPYKKSEKEEPKQQQEAKASKSEKKDNEEQEDEEEEKGEEGKKKKKDKEKKKKKKVESEEEEVDDNDVDDLAAYMGIAPKKSGGGPPKRKPEPKVVTQKAKEPEVFSDEEDGNKKKGKKKGKAAATTQKKKGKDEDEDDEEEEVATSKKDQKKDKKKPKPKNESEEDEEEDEEEEEEGGDDKNKQEGGMPTHLVDEYLKEAFLTALKISVKDKELPIEASAFFKDHVLACRREGVSVDIKNSSYKKVGKFLQIMNKQGFIEYKEAKKNLPPQITKVMRTNKELAEFEPIVQKAFKKEAPEEKKEDDEIWPKVEIEELFKPKDNIKFIFEKDGKLPKEYFTHTEVRDVFSDYIKPKLQKKYVIFDLELLKAFPQVRNMQQEEEKEEEKEHQAPKDDEETQEGDKDKEKKKKKKIDDTIKMTKDETYKLLEEGLEVYHQIRNLTTNKDEIRKGAFKGIHLVAEKSHNKNITKITGLEQFGFDLQKLSPKFQLKYACSVSIHDLPGKNVGKELMVHGNFLPELIDYFTLECKVDPKFITQQNKLDKKKKI